MKKWFILEFECFSFRHGPRLNPDQHSIAANSSTTTVFESKVRKSEFFQNKQTYEFFSTKVDKRKEMGQF
jgi:hypothetical protein